MQQNYNLEDFFRLLKDVDIDDFIKLVRFSKKMIDSGHEDAIIKAIDAWYINHDVNTSCDELFMKLCFNNKYLGTIYLKQIILDILSNNYSNKINSKSIFSYIARKNNTTSSRVEKNIRDSINICWANMDNNIKTTIFPGLNKKPGSLRFIIYVVNYQKIHLHNPKNNNNQEENGKKLVLTLG